MMDVLRGISATNMRGFPATVFMGISWDQKVGKQNKKDR